MYAANLKLSITQVNSLPWYIWGFSRSSRSIARCLLLQTGLELLSLENDKYYSFEETITGDYGNQTMNWNTYSSQKTPGFTSDKCLGKNYAGWIVLKHSKIIRSIWPSVNHARKIFIPLPNLYLHFLFLKLPEQTNLLPLRIFINRCYQPFKVSLHQHLTLWYPAF